MSYEEEKENKETNNEENNPNKKNKIQKEKSGKRELIFTAIILASVIIGILGIFSNNENKTSPIQITSSFNSKISGNSIMKEGIAIIDLTGVITHSSRKSSIGFEYPIISPKGKPIIQAIINPLNTLSNVISKFCTVYESTQDLKNSLQVSIKSGSNKLLSIFLARKYQIIIMARSTETL